MATFTSAEWIVLAACAAAAAATFGTVVAFVTMGAPESRLERSCEARGGVELQPRGYGPICFYAGVASL